MKQFKSLETVSVRAIERIQRPENKEPLDLVSPAADIFTDFMDSIPLMLEQGTPVDDALEMMQRTHVKLHLVIDSKEAFRGVISLADLLSVRVMRAAERTGLRREDLAVSHVMTRKDELRAIDINELRSARVGDLLATMRTYGDQHVLIVDIVGGSIRGMVSSTDIARRLHIPVNINKRANSFAEVYQAVMT